MSCSTAELLCHSLFKTYNTFPLLDDEMSVMSSELLSYLFLELVALEPVASSFLLLFGVARL